jgi:D-alanyl-lipoteichoic acid acyltransferase DltB (MBOAT superfamily)
VTFHSIDYLLFLPLVVAIYFATPHRWRWAVLLIASYGFYAAWRVEFSVLLMISTLADYNAFPSIHSSPSATRSTSTAGGSSRSGT